MEKMWSVTFLRYDFETEGWHRMGITRPVWTMCTDKKHVIDMATRSYSENWEYAHVVIVSRAKDGISFARVRQGYGKYFKLYRKLNSLNYV